MKRSWNMFWNQLLLCSECSCGVTFHQFQSWLKLVKETVKHSRKVSTEEPLIWQEMIDRYHLSKSAALGPTGSSWAFKQVRLWWFLWDGVTHLRCWAPDDGSQRKAGHTTSSCDWSRECPACSAAGSGREWRRFSVWVFGACGQIRLEHAPWMWSSHDFI